MRIAGERARAIAAAVLLATLTASCGGDGERPSDGDDSTRAEPVVRQDLPWHLEAGDAGRTGSTPDPGPEAMPGILWSTPVTPNMTSEPVRARTASGRELVLLGSGTEVLAIDRVSGRIQWSHDMESVVNAAPVALGDRVLAVSLDGLADFLSLESGERVAEIEWDFVLQSSPLPLEPADGSPPTHVVLEETSYSARDPISMLRAVNPETAEESWRFGYELGLGALAAADGERVYAVAADRVVALDRRTGELAWEHEFPVQQRVTGPVVAGGRVLLAYGGRAQWTATAIDARSGEVAWTQLLGSRLTAPFAVAGDAVLYPRFDGTMRRLALADGRELGDFALEGVGAVQLRPSVTPDRIYVADRESVAAIDRATGEVLWRLELAASPVSLSVAGGELLVTTEDGFVHALGS